MKRKITTISVAGLADFNRKTQKLVDEGFLPNTDITITIDGNRTIYTQQFIQAEI